MFRIGDKVVFARDLVPHGNRTAYEGPLASTYLQLSTKTLYDKDIELFIGKTCEIVNVKSAVKDDDWFQYALRHNDKHGNIEYFLADSDEIEFVTKPNEVTRPEVSSKYRY